MSYANRFSSVVLASSLLLGACGDDGAATSDVPMGDMAVASGTASLTGSVTRSATPTAGGDGDVYIAVFDRDPVLDMANAMVVGSGFLEDADLSADGATVPYTIEDIAVRAEPYFLIAFMDDNDNVDASDMANAGPDSGDLLSLRGLASVSVTLDTPGAHDLDIDLNSVLP